MSLFSKFKDIDEITISDFVASIPEKFSETIQLLSSCNSRIEDPIVLTNRIKLQNFVKNFHQDANTMTEGVNSSIKLLDLPDTLVFVTTHQPNLFSYGGIFKKIVLIKTLKDELERQHKTEKKIVNLFIILDHDFMDEIWIRRAQLPSIRHSKGILELQFHINKSNKWNMVSKMPLPGRETLDYWRGQIKSWIKNLSISNYTKTDKSHLLKNFEEFWIQVELSYSKAKTYSDFNSFLMSQIVNRIWNYDTLFARLSNISPIFENGFKYLIYNSKKYSEALRKAERLLISHGIQYSGISSNSAIKAPIWLHCNCGSKASAILQNDVNEQLHLVGVCTSCKKDLGINLGNKNELDSLKDNLDNISPRAIPILLLLSKSLDVTCYVSGSGGVGYMVYGSLTYSELDIKRPINIYWPSHDIYYGFGQLEALEQIGKKKQSAVDTYLESLREKEIEHRNKIKPFLKERREKIISGQQIERLLSELFILKQEQREIRKNIKVAEKVKNTLNVTPCIIDYAVNFGIRDIEIQWRKNLIKSDNLALPLILSINDKYPQ